MSYYFSLSLLMGKYSYLTIEFVMVNSILIYSDKNLQSSRNIWISIEEGDKLHVIQHDMGLLTEMICSDDDYERELSNIPLDKLKEVLNLNRVEDIFEEFKKRFNKVDSFDRIQEFLSEYGIPYEYSSY